MKVLSAVFVICLGLSQVKGDFNREWEEYKVGSLVRKCHGLLFLA
jgi:hypothetical protein